MRAIVLAIVLVVGCSQPDKKAAPPPAPQPKPMTKGVVERPLFSPEVALESLPLSIGIETLGGVSSIVLARGAKLPATFSDVFSTAMDGQTRVEVHVVQGERPLANDNRTLGRFQLHGIPSAPRGVPQIEVTFTVDANGVLNVSARDKLTHESHEIRIEGALQTLDKAAVQKILDEAAAHHAEDTKVRAWLDTRFKLDQMLYDAKRLQATLESKLSAKLLEKWKTAVAQAESALAANMQPGNAAPLQAAYEAFRLAQHAATEAAYRTTR